MKAFIFSNRKIMSILKLSTETQECQKLLKSILPIMGCTIASYMYNILSTYMLHYVPINDIDLSTDKHNRLYDKFVQASNFLDSTDYDVRQIDHMESILSIGMVDLYGKFDSTLYDDLHRTLSDYYTELYGSSQMDRYQDQIVEELDAVAELTMQLAKEIESVYLRHDDTSVTSDVLFGVKGDNLIVFVH